MVDAKFWAGKRVFITGHTGFKGSWLSLWLHSLGAVVKGFSLEPPTTPSMYNEAQVGTAVQSQIGDIRDYSALHSAIAEFCPEIVFHLAAQPLVRLSYDEPVETYSSNVMGTVHLLDAIRKVGGVKAAVIITSDKCYENREWVWGYREDDPKGGYDPYSNSKGCAELVVDAYRASFFNSANYEQHGCTISSARAGNVIGGGDWAADRLLPDILRAFEKKDSVEIRRPHAIRPWQHVLEPLSGYLLLAQKSYLFGPEYAGGWNFGPKDEDAKPVDWICDQLCSIWGDGASWHLTGTTHPHEAAFLKLDCSKAASYLSWHPRWGLQAALGRVVEWHRAWISGKDMQRYSLDEISTYMNCKVK